MSADEPRGASVAPLGRLGGFGRVLRRQGRLPRRGWAESETLADLNQERLWQLLGRGVVTLAELHEQGVTFPAQGMYDLQIAGYSIDRLRVRDRAGQSTFGYRLTTRSQAVFDQGAPHAPVDPHLTGLRPVAGVEPC
jgi:hypothetical protein